MNFNHTRRACNTGYVTQAIVLNLAPLLFVIFQNKFHVSLGFLAFLTLVTFLIQIAIDVIAVRFVERFGYRFLAVSSQFVSAAGLVMMSFLPSVIMPEIGLLAATLVYSSGSALAEVVLSPLAEGLPGDGKGGASLALLHSFYAWGQTAVILVTTGLLVVLTDALWWIVPLIWALVPIFNGIMFLIVPMIPMAESDTKHDGVKLFRYKYFALAFLLMICSGASEQAMAQWASYYAERGLSISKTVGDLLGPCIFALMMALGRTYYGIKGAKLNLNRALLLCSVLTFGCYMTAVFAPFPLLSLAAVGLAGLGCSLMWPGMLSVSAVRFPQAGAAMFALMALGGDIGCSLGPWLTGTVSGIIEKYPGDLAGPLLEQHALKAGFLVGSIFPLVMILGMIAFCKKKK